MTDQEMLKRAIKMSVMLEGARKLNDDILLKEQLEGGDEAETKTLGLMAQMMPGFFSAPDDEEMEKRAEEIVKLYKEIFEGEPDG